MGLIRGMARTAVVAGTATAVSNRVSRRQAGRWAAQEAPPQYYDQQAPPAPAAPPAPTSGSDDLMEKLQKLGDLRDQGILTPAEFDAQKAKLLAG
jgi:hypothetical protein